MYCYLVTSILEGKKKEKEKIEVSNPGIEPSPSKNGDVPVHFVQDRIPKLRRSTCILLSSTTMIYSNDLIPKLDIIFIKRY